MHGRTQIKFAKHLWKLVLKFLCKSMDLAWLAKVILIEDIHLCFTTQNSFIPSKHKNITQSSAPWWLYVPEADVSGHRNAPTQQLICDLLYIVSVG